MSDSHLLNTVKKYITANSLISPGNIIIVGVSGGSDSVALLHILRAMFGNAITLFAAHLEHGIRGYDSLNDARFVETLCKTLSVPLILRQENIPVSAKQKGVSIETAAREARYAFFAEAASANGANLIATAHHNDDQAETFLLRLLRGSSARGLSGMLPSRPITPENPGVRLIRPFLCVTRSDIEAYISQNNLSFREDASNSDIAYTRNRIRHRLIPTLREYNPNISQSIAKTAESLSQDDDALSAQAADVISGAGALLFEVTAYGARLKPLALSQVHPAVSRRVITTLLAQIGIRGATYEQITSLASGTPINLPGNWHCETFRDMLCFVSSKTAKPKFTFDIQSVLAIRTESLKRLSQNDKYRCFMNADTLLALMRRGKISFRTRKPGDRIRPLGSGGTQKLKQYLMEKCIEKPMRDIMPLLAFDSDEGSEILWVPGCGTSQTVAVPLDKSRDGVLGANVQIAHVRLQIKNIS